MTPPISNITPFIIFVVVLGWKITFLKLFSLTIFDSVLHPKRSKRMSITLQLRTPKGGMENLIPLQIDQKCTIAELKKTLVNSIEDFKEHEPNDMRPYNPERPTGKVLTLPSPTDPISLFRALG